MAERDLALSRHPAGHVAALGLAVPREGSNSQALSLGLSSYFMCGVREGLLSAFPYFIRVGYLGVGCCSVSCSVPGTQLSLLSIEMLWFSKGNLNSLETKGAHGDEQQETWAQKGDGEAGEGQGLLGWAEAGAEPARARLGSPGAKGSQPRTGAWEVQGQHSLPGGGCAALGPALERTESPSWGSSRLGWAGPQLASSRAGDSPAPKGAWMGARFPCSAAGMILEDSS